MDAEAAAGQAAAEAAHQQALGIYHSLVASQLSTEHPMDDNEVVKLISRNAKEEVVNAVLLEDESNEAHDVGYKPRGLACFLFPKREGLADGEHQLQLQALRYLLRSAPAGSLYVCHHEVLRFLTVHLTQLRGGEWRAVIQEATGRLRALERELWGLGHRVRALLQLQLLLDSLVTAQWARRCSEKVEQARQAGEGSAESAEAVSVLLKSLTQRVWDVARSFRNSTAGQDAAEAIVSAVSEDLLGEGLYAAVQELSRSDNAENVVAQLITCMDEFQEGGFAKLASATRWMIEVLLEDARRPECCGPAFHFGVLSYADAHDAFTVFILHQYATVTLENALGVLTMACMLWDLVTAMPMLDLVKRISQTVALLDPTFASKMRRDATVQAMVAENIQGMRAFLHFLGLPVHKVEETVAAVVGQAVAGKDIAAALAGVMAALKVGMAPLVGELAAEKADVAAGAGVAATTDARLAATDARLAATEKLVAEQQIVMKRLEGLLRWVADGTLTREQVLDALKVPPPAWAFGSPGVIEKADRVVAEHSAAGSSRTTAASAAAEPEAETAAAAAEPEAEAAAAPAAAEPVVEAEAAAAAEPETGAAAAPAAAEPEAAAAGSHAVAAVSVAAAPVAAVQAAERSGSSAAAAGGSNCAVERGQAGVGLGRNAVERQQRREQAVRQKEEREKEAIRLVQAAGSAIGTVTHTLGGTLQRTSCVYVFGHALQLQAQRRQALALRRQQHEDQKKEAAARQAEAQRRQEEAAGRRQAAEKQPAHRA